MACASGIDHVMQWRLNVTLKTVIKNRNDLVNYNVAPMEIDFMDQQQLEEVGYDESIAGNFKQMAREADLSPQN